MVNELLPGAFTSPRDWYCGGGAAVRQTLATRTRTPAHGPTALGLHLPTYIAASVLRGGALAFAAFRGRVAGLDDIRKVGVAVAVRVQQAALLLRGLRTRGKGASAGRRRGARQAQGRRGATHALDHHGAAPIGGLGPGHLLHVVDHHGADAVGVSVAAVGDRTAVGPQVRPTAGSGRAGRASAVPSSGHCPAGVGGAGPWGRPALSGHSSGRQVGTPAQIPFSRDWKSQGPPI